MDEETVWLPDKSGTFSLSSAFEEIRWRGAETFAFKHSWHTKQYKSIQLFQWKVLHRILPFPDNLNRFNFTIYPTMCPFCKKDDDQMDHILFNCSYSKDIWRYFMGIFEVPFPIGPISIRQVFISWWLEAGTKTIGDIFKHNMASIISWHIWKIYAQYVWGNIPTILPNRFVIQQIKTFTRDWSIAKPRNDQYSSMIPVLIEEHLISADFICKKRRIHLVKWKLPVLDLKMNIDASFSLNGSAEGAVMRDRSGNFVFALQFPISAKSALEAEFLALAESVTWAIDDGYLRFEVESDSKEVINTIFGVKSIGGRSMIERLRFWNDKGDCSDIYCEKPTGRLISYPGIPEVIFERIP